MQCSFENWQLADVVVTPKGGKQCPLQTSAKAPIILSPPFTLTTPFGPSVYEGNPNVARLNLDFRCNPELEEWCKKFDQWAVNYIATNSEKLFGKKMTTAQVKDSLRPLAVKRNEDYPALLRTKLQTTGPMQVRYWNPKGEVCEPPEDWRQCEFKVRLHVRSLYLMGKDFGWVSQATDIQVFERKIECPFEAVAEEEDGMDVCPL